MFLVMDRQAGGEDRTAWVHLRGLSVREPAPVKIPDWRLGAGDSWLVTGPEACLDAMVTLLADPGHWAVAGGGPGCVLSPGPLEKAGRSPLALLRRWLRWPDKGRALARQWTVGLAEIEAAEARVLVAVARLVAKGAPVLVLDRVLDGLRPFLRKRLSDILGEEVASRGLTVLVLATEAPEGWQAAGRRAVFRKGVLEPVFRA